MADEVSGPQKISPEHDLSAFDSGEPILDQWLRRRALQNEASGTSRTYVVCSGNRVVGYYSLAAGAVAHAQAPGRIRRNTPEPFPVMVLGRLAVDTTFRSRGMGAALLRDAILRTLQASEIAGIRALLVHAISPTAKRFYESHGFMPSPVDPMILMITISDAARALTA